MHALAAAGCAIIAGILAACGERDAPSPAVPPTALASAAQSPIWFICDGIDAPLLAVATRVGARVEIGRLDKMSGAEGARETYTVSTTEGAAGSVYTTLSRDGAEAAGVRAINTGVLENPGSAYTELVSTVTIDGETTSCRWLARTRVLGFTARRSFVINEDADGDLIYTTYDFADAANQEPIALSENQRSTPFSVEVRAGEERLSGNGAEFRFARAEYAYVVMLPRSGEGQVTVLRDGEAIQTEPIIAYQIGNAG